MHENPFYLDEAMAMMAVVSIEHRIIYEIVVLCERGLKNGTGSANPKHNTKYPHPHMSGKCIKSLPMFNFDAVHM